MQYSDREMSQLTFNHLLNLSLSFHTRRKTGEILRILDRGAAINHILEVCPSIKPFAAGAQLLVANLIQHLANPCRYGRRTRHLFDLFHLVAGCRDTRRHDCLQ